MGLILQYKIIVSSLEFDMKLKKMFDYVYCTDEKTLLLPENLISLSF